MSRSELGRSRRVVDQLLAAVNAGANDGLAREAFHHPVLFVQAPAEAQEGQPRQDVIQPMDRPHLRQLSAQEIDRLGYLQDYLLTELRRTRIADSPNAERLRELEALVLDEAQGIVRNEDGEITARIGRPYYGEATREALRLWVEFLERQQIPGLYRTIADARSQMPTRGPIPLQVDDGGRPIATNLFLQRARNGQLQCNLNIALHGDTIPGWTEVRRLSNALEFIDRAEAVGRRNALARQQEIVRRRIQRMGMPGEWPTDTPEQCQAAMSVMSLANETSRIVACIDHLSRTVTPARRAELEALIAPANLPPGVRIERAGGRPDGAMTVRFDFPRHLDLQDPSFRPQLRAMFEFCERNGRTVDQMMAAEGNIRTDARNTIAWLDVPAPHGWVRMTPGNNGEVNHEFSVGQQPQGAGWARCNLIEFRANVTEDRDANTGNVRSVRVVNTMDYCDIPWFSYLDLYRPRAAGCQQLQSDSGPRDPDDWACVRVSPSEMRFMRYRDLSDHADEQAFWYWAGKGTVAAMDLSMLVGGISSVAVGVRAARAARTVAGVTQMVETATARGAVHTGADLMARLATDTARRAAQQQLATAARRQIYHGIRDIFLAVSSVPATNTAAHETPGLREFAIARSVYMLASIGRHLAFDGPRSLIRTALGREAPLSQRLIEATLQAGPSWIRTSSTAAQWGGGLSQIPFSLEQWRVLRQMADADDPTRDAMNDARTRRTEAREFHSDLFRNALRDRLPGVGASSIVEIGRTLERFQASLGVNDQARANQIRAIIEGTRELLAAAPHLNPEFVGPPDPRRVQEWEERRRRFIDERIAPLFLASGQQIRDSEVRRAETASLPVLRRQRAFTDQQIHSMELAQEFGPRDREVRAAAAVALLYLCRTGSDTLSGVNREGNNAPGQGVLFERQELTPAWSVSRTTGSGENEQTETFAVGQRRVGQQIRLSEVMALLEGDLQPATGTVRRIETGAILTRFGLPGEGYAGVLRNIIQNADTPAAERNRAILYLGSIMQGLRTAEAGRGALSQDARDQLEGINNGLNSRALQRFLIEFARDPNNDLASRAMARYVAMFRDRNHLGQAELTRFRTILERNPPALTFAEFAEDMRAGAFQANPQTVADWERRFQAARVLADFPDVAQADLGCTQVEVNSALAACVNAAATFEETAAAQRVVLQRAIDENRGQVEITRLRQELNRTNLQRVQAADIALAAVQELLTPVRQNGILRRRIDHMDASDDATVRNAAIVARRALLDLLKKKCETGEDVRIRTQIMAVLEPLLSDARLVRADAHGQETRTQLAAMRLEMARVLRALLLPSLNQQAVVNQHVANHPGLLHMPTVSQYVQLYAASQNAELGAPLREAAIYALTQLNDRASTSIIRTRVLTENEPEPDVRLAAVRALQRMLPAEEMRRLVQDLQARTVNDPAHPPELDPGVAIQLEQRFAPVGMGIAPDGAVFRRVHADAMAMLANRDNDDRAIINNIRQHNSWLLPGNLRGDIARAMAGVYSNRFTYFWEDWNATPGAPTYRASANERAAGDRVLQAFRDRFDRLCITASEGAQDEANRAREALYWILTTDETSWARTSQDNQLNRGFGNNPIPLGLDTFRGMQTLACDALVRAVTRVGEDGRPVRLPDAQAAHVEQLILRAIVHPNTPTTCRIELLEAIRALSRPEAANATRERAAEIPMRFCAGIADRLLALLREPTTGTERQRTQEMQLRERFGRYAIHYLVNHSDDPRIMAQLQAIADSRHLSAYTRQYALDSIANHRDRVLLVLGAVRPDQVNGNNLEVRTATLESARTLAEPVQLVVDGQVQNDAQAVDVTRDLGELRARSAVELIFQATRGLPIESAQDARGQLLLGLLNPRYHERVRLAAAIALVNESRVPEHREEAIRLLAERSVQSLREGLRRDALYTLRGLPQADRGRIGEAYSTLSGRLIAGMRTHLTQNGVQNAADLGEDEIVRRLQQLNNNPSRALLMQYARCLTMVGAQMRSDSPHSAARYLTTAVNIYRGEPVDAPVVPADVQHWWQPQALIAFRGTGQTREVAFALDQLAELHSEYHHSHREARLLHSAARGIIYYSLGSSSRERIESDLRSMRLIRQEAADAARAVNELRANLQELEARLAEARRAPNGNNVAELEQEVTQARTTYRQRLEAQDRSLENTARTFADTRSDSVMSNLVRVCGRDSRQLAEYADMRADVLMMVARAKLNLAALEQNQTNRQRLEELANTNARQAIQVLRRALEIRIQLGRPADEILNNRQRLVNLYFQGGSMQGCREQLEAMQTLLGSANTARAAEVQRQLGIVQFRLENREAGDACFARWLAITRAMHGERSEQVGEVLDRQARMLMGQRRFDRAEMLLREGVLCEAEGPGQDTLADRYFALGDACFGQPTRRQHAIAALERCLEIRRARGPGEAVALRNLWSTTRVLAQLDAHDRIERVVDAHALALEEAEVARPQIVAFVNSYAQFLDQEAARQTVQTRRTSIEQMAARLRARWRPAGQ